MNVQPWKIRSIARNMPSTHRLLTGQPIAMTRPASAVTTPAAMIQPEPWRRPMLEADPDAQQSGSDQAGGQKQGQHGRGQQRVGEGDDARDRIEQAAEQPPEKAAPGLDAEGMGDFEAAGDQHHEADEIDRCDGCDEQIAERDDADDQASRCQAPTNQPHLERNSPMRPFSASDMSGVKVMAVIPPVNIGQIPSVANLLEAGW